MKIYEIITPVAPPIKPGTPPPPAAPGTPPPPAAPGTPPAAAPVKPGTPPPPAAPATPTPKMQQDLKSMSDQFTALKLKYDQLQKQILTPQA